MINIGEAAHRRYLFYFIFTADQKIFRVFDPYLDDILVQGKAGFLFEKGAKITGVQTRYLGHFFDRRFFGIMFGNMADNFFNPEIPRRRINVINNQLVKTV